MADLRRGGHRARERQAERRPAGRWMLTACLIAQPMRYLADAIGTQLRRLHPAE